MSWEIVSDESVPCPCGQGYVNWVSRSDDWGRTDDNESLHCTECEKSYVKYIYDYHSSGMIESAIKWVKRDDYEKYLKLKSESDAADNLANTQVTEYLRSHYLEPWLALFEDVPRNKKAVWNKLRELRLTGYSYALFCKKIEAYRLNNHIESFVSYLFSGHVLRILEVNDENVETLAASSRDANERYNEARRVMLQRSFSYWSLRNKHTVI